MDMEHLKDAHLYTCTLDITINSKLMEYIDINANKLIPNPNSRLGWIPVLFHSSIHNGHFDFLAEAGLDGVH